MHTASSDMEASALSEAVETKDWVVQGIIDRTPYCAADRGVRGQRASPRESFETHNRGSSGL